MTYQYLAQVYDDLMGDYDYDEVYHFLESQVDHFGNILEMACGTGSLTEKLVKKGPVTAFDGSEEMLQVARDKLGYNPRVFLLRQDLRTFQLTEKYRTILCFCDSLNYLLKPGDLLSSFQQVEKHLEEGGLFIFDVNTVHKYRAMGEEVFFQENENALGLWQNTYHEDSQINDYNLTLFYKDQDQDLYHREDEFHRQRAYGQEEIENLLDQAGLDPLAFYDGYRELEAREDTDRLICLARKKENA